LSGVLLACSIDDSGNIETIKEPGVFHEKVLGVDILSKGAFT
jgi:hypothetical protein